jgi:hypothetical protein
MPHYIYFLLCEHALEFLTADEADYGLSVSGPFAQVFTSLFSKIKGLFFVTVKKNGNEIIAGIKTFSTAPVIPGVNALPAAPSATRPATEKQVLDAAVRKTESVNASVWGVGTVNDEQGRTWEHNTYNALLVKESVLGNGRSGAGSRIELDLDIQFNLACSVNLSAGAEIVFLSNPINLLWNANGILGGSVGTAWIADSSAANSNTAGYVWAFPAPVQLEETGQQPFTSKICNNMNTALAYSGGAGTPGQLYACGGMRVLAALDYPSNLLHRTHAYRV